MSSGFLALVRLVGTVYFKKNLATVVSKLGVETPNQLFNSTNQSNMTDEERHQEWHHAIKRVIHITSENQRPPTLSALRRHWLTLCWIKGMWNNSTKADQHDGLASPETHGWIKEVNGEYLIDWDAKEVVQKIQDTLDFLCKGCACKSGCRTKRCSCQKKGIFCGAGCECRDCSNMQLGQKTQVNEECTNEDHEEDRCEYEDDNEETYIEETEDEETENEETEDVDTEIITDLDFMTDLDFLS